MKSIHRSMSGFSVVEFLMVMSILVMLAAITYAAMAPARENARRAVCVSNLHQIGKALSMYQADYDGIEPNVNSRLSNSEMGIPSGQGPMFHFLQTYIKNTGVLFCSSYHDDVPIAKRASTYWLIGFEGPGYWGTHYTDAVERHGLDTAVIACEQHNDRLDPMTQPRWERRRIVALRLNQNVDVRMIPVRAISTFDW